ncbi:MAG: hypothetical protein IPO15_24405 [Anaerolineae bacterium]|nr:hypothetical protein [Anaerolineae bacterium]
MISISARCRADDPLTLYLREMGRVPLTPTPGHVEMAGKQLAEGRLKTPPSA